jgi:hypothetical protein
VVAVVAETTLLPTMEVLVVAQTKIIVPEETLYSRVLLTEGSVMQVAIIVHLQVEAVEAVRDK